MRLRWHCQALTDLRGIYDHVAKDSPAAARRIVASIQEQAKVLLRHPAIGRPGRLPATRELVVTRYPYIVAYREHGVDVEILLVVHTSRRWPDQLP